MMRTAGKTRKTTPLFLFLASMVMLCFYLVAHVLIDNVYSNAVVGALFELLSLPMLVLLVVIPMFSAWVFFKSAQKSILLFILTLLACIGSVLALAYQ